MSLLNMSALHERLSDPLKKLKLKFCRTRFQKMLESEAQLLEFDVIVLLISRRVAETWLCLVASEQGSI